MVRGQKKYKFSFIFDVSDNSGVLFDEQRKRVWKMNG